MGNAPQLKFDRADSLAANQAWGANCGPHALAAVSGLSLGEIRGHLRSFKGWMSPTMIGDALRSMDVPYRLRKGLKANSLCSGINRLQWKGSWLNPGVPVAAAYAHTHWVAHFDGHVLCTVASCARWVPTEDWRGQLESMGRFWYVTHHYELVMPPGLVSGGRVGREVEQACTPLNERAEAQAIQQVLFK